MAVDDRDLDDLGEEWERRLAHVEAVQRATKPASVDDTLEERMAQWPSSGVSPQLMREENERMRRTEERIAATEAARLELQAQVDEQRAVLRQSHAKEIARRQHERHLRLEEIREIDEAMLRRAELVEAARLDGVWLFDHGVGEVRAELPIVRRPPGPLPVPEGMVVSFASPPPVLTDRSRFKGGKK